MGVNKKKAELPKERKLTQEYLLNIGRDKSITEEQPEKCVIDIAVDDIAKHTYTPGEIQD